MRKKERLSEEDADLSCQAPDLPELSQSAGGGREALRWPPPKARRVTIIAVIVSDEPTPEAARSLLTLAVKE